MRRAGRPTPVRRPLSRTGLLSQRRDLMAHLARYRGVVIHPIGMAHRAHVARPGVHALDRLTVADGAALVGHDGVDLKDAFPMAAQARGFRLMVCVVTVEAQTGAGGAWRLAVARGAWEAEGHVRRVRKLADGRGDRPGGCARAAGVAPFAGDRSAVVTVGARRW